MTEKSRLENMEQGIGRRSAFCFVVLFTLGWLVMSVADWHLRFTRYEYNKRFISVPRRPVAMDAERPLFVTNQVAASRGGDLTNLIGIRSLVEEYAEVRPAGLRIEDWNGYMNRPYDPGRTPDIVVVGDSFMAAGNVNDMFASQLSDRSGLFVYNHAMQGHGPFISIYRFLDNPQFVGRRPPLVIWGFAEREINGISFVGMVYQLSIREQNAVPKSDVEVAVSPQVRVNWRLLTPHELEGGLPDTSFIAQAGEWMWKRIRYHVFGQLTPWVVEAAQPVVGGPMLFYRYHIDLLARADAIPRLNAVGQSIETLDRFLHDRGMKLVVVLIPEKEQVYRYAIPVTLNPPESPIPSSVLWDVERDLNERGIRVFNMLPAFQEATRQGKLVYWRDDTHWNPNGVEIAVDLVLGKIKESRPNLDDL